MKSFIVILILYGVFYLHELKMESHCYGRISGQNVPHQYSKRSLFYTDFHIKWSLNIQLSLTDAI